MYIIENLDSGKKISLSNNDLELAYEALSEYQDYSEEVADQVFDLIDNLHQLG
jgi:hypothetical protein